MQGVIGRVVPSTDTYDAYGRVVRRIRPEYARVTRCERCASDDLQPAINMVNNGGMTPWICRACRHHSWPRPTGRTVVQDVRSPGS
jgi:hypothetical protein